MDSGILGAMSPSAKWAVGLGVLVLGGGFAAWWYKWGPGSKPLPGGGGGRSGGGGGGGSAPVQGDRNAEITLSVSGSFDIVLVPGTPVTLFLPPNASWSAPLSATGSVSVGSAPRSGQNPAGFVYDGGTQDAGGYGGHVVANWAWSAAPDVTQTSTLNISDA